MSPILRPGWRCPVPSLWRASPSTRVLPFFPALPFCPTSSHTPPAAPAFPKLCSVYPETPKVLATEKVASPPRTNRPASCLNSSVYCPRTVPAIPKPSKADPTQSALGDVLQGQGHDDPANQKAYKVKTGKDLAPPATWDDFAAIASFFSDPAKRMCGATL